MSSKQIKNRKITVLHIVPTGDLKTGGAAYAAIRLAHEQARLGVSVYIMELTSHLIKKEKWWCNDVKYLNLDCGAGLITKLIHFRRLCVNTEIIVHFHGLWIPKYTLFFILLLSTNTPFIISPHGSLEPGALRQKYLKKHLARKLFFNFFWKKAAVFWACSEKERANVQGEFPQVPVHIVSIGVDMPSMTGQSLIRNVIVKRKVILLISRISFGKGILNLVRAWDLIRDESWELLLAGPDEAGHQSEVEKEIKELELDDSFTFVGYVDAQKRDNLYREADIFVLPSLSENFGIVVAEAMSYGLPVLTTSETPWNHLGLDRGVLCVGTTPIELAQGLRKMMQITEAEKSKIGAASRAFTLENFAWPKVAKASILKLKLVNS